jgi:hypothetical protein
MDPEFGLHDGPSPTQQDIWQSQADERQINDDQKQRGHELIVFIFYKNHLIQKYTESG